MNYEAAEAALNCECARVALDDVREFIRSQQARIAELEGELDQFHYRIANLESVLHTHGFRRCDIPACNCGSWHHATAQPGSEGR